MILSLLKVTTVFLQRHILHIPFPTLNILCYAKSVPQFYLAQLHDRNLLRLNEATATEFMFINSFRSP